MTGWLKALLGFHVQMLSWMQENRRLGFLLVFMTSAFLALFILYLIVANIRLHIRIRQLNRDKNRLMEEKDLMRRGIMSGAALAVARAAALAEKDKLHREARNLENEHEAKRGDSEAGNVDSRNAS